MGKSYDRGSDGLDDVCMMQISAPWYDMEASEWTIGCVGRDAACLIMSGHED